MTCKEIITQYLKIMVLTVLCILILSVVATWETLDYSFVMAPALTVNPPISMKMKAAG